ncbi:MAG: hypothetical protein ACYC1I_12810 [Acidimicrobiales bacterium]
MAVASSSSGRGAIIIIIIIFLAIFVLYIAAYWRLFTKAGEPGWGAIVPIYNLTLLHPTRQHRDRAHYRPGHCEDVLEIIGVRNWLVVAELDLCPDPGFWFGGLYKAGGSFSGIDFLDSWICAPKPVVIHHNGCEQTTTVKVHVS